MSNLDYDILQWNGSAPKKKIARVSPCFLHLKILKVPFWATWSSGGVVISIVVVPIAVVIVVERGTMQKTKS
jgi:hypothetical protein